MHDDSLKPLATGFESRYAPPMDVRLPNGYTTQVDEEDWIGRSLFLLPWYAVHQENGRIYVVARFRNTVTGEKHALRLHRVILNAPPHLDVDHRVGEGLDNRRRNLRLCTNALNQQNTSSRGGSSRYKGVSWHAKKGKWLVAFRANGEYHFVGYFGDEEEAARAYDAKVTEVVGEFARLNFPRDRNSPSNEHDTVLIR